MKGYLLDTNIISDLIRNPDGVVYQHINNLGSERICTSIVVACELRYGGAKKNSKKLSARIEEMLQAIPVLPLIIPGDIKYGNIRTELEALGQPIGMNDLLIAAHALTLDFILVTDNDREFNRVQGLVVENWLRK